MAAIFPLGTFIRGRRDWNVNGLMLGTGQISLSNTTAKITLNNNTATGAWLAVYAILAWNPTRPALCQLYTQGALVPPSGLVTQQMLVPGMPAIDGYLSATTGVFGSDPAPAVIFNGDGINWLTLGDCPCVVLPPGYSCSVRQFVMFGNYV